MPIPELAGRSPVKDKPKPSMWKMISTIAAMGFLGLTASLSSLPPHVSASFNNTKPFKEFPRKVHRL